MSNLTLSKLTSWLRWVSVLAMLTALPSHAQYKVIGADGRTTYTDRPPASGTPGKVQSLGIQQTAPAVGGGDPSFPVELRQAASRYPVTLYVISSTCVPCTKARQLLRDRGIPYQEKQVQTAEDNEALERISGGREAPTLTIGVQTLHGLAPSVWHSYLDAAGYPRDPRLPANYVYPLPTPLTERRETTSSTVVNKPAPRASAPIAGSPTPAASGNPANIKF
jgi:glutaredoxin